MSDFWELIINFFRKIAGFDLIELRPPLPELLTIVSLTICSFRISNLISDVMNLLMNRSKLPHLVERGLLFSAAFLSGIFALNAIWVLFSGTSYQRYAILFPAFFALCFLGALLTDWAFGTPGFRKLTTRFFNAFMIVLFLAATLSYLILFGSYLLELVVLYVGNQFGLFEEFRDLRAPTGD